MGPEDGQGTEESEAVANSQEDSGGLNPAWNDLMGIIPTQLHSQVTPHLQKWDQNYQTGINKVHSQYEAYKPYLENQIAPDQINYALQLMNAIEQRPQEVLTALQQYMGIEQQQPQEDEQGQEEIPSDFLNHPQFKQMNEMVNAMAQLMVQQNQTSQQAAEDQALETELSSLKEQHGEFDEDWVLSKALANPKTSLEDIVKSYHEFVNGVIANQRKPGPNVMSPGGQAPNNQINPKELDDKSRRNLVVQMLEAAAQQNH